MFLTRRRFVNTKMYLHLQIVILCLSGTYIQVACEEDGNSTTPWSGDKLVCVENIFTPIWHSSFEQHAEFACGINNYGNISKREPEYSHQFCTTETPWDKIHVDSNYLAIYCRPNYKPPDFATDIENGVLGRYTNLLNMKLERCRLSSLTNKTFAGLSRLVVIWITSNFIHTVTEGAFDGFTNLKWLRFSNNSLANQTDIFFDSCIHQKLEFIQLGTNNVSEIHVVNTKNDTCSGLKVSSLVLGDNPIHMKEKMFEIYHISGILTLTKCHIVKLEASYLYGLGELQVIDLGYNRISELPKSVFSSMKNLIRITLNNNCLTHVDVDKSFANLPLLQSLTLQENNISIIHGSFSNIPTLTELGLAQNALTHITKQTFGYMDNLLTLYLGHNQIETIELDTFRHYRTLEILDLSHNKLTSVDTLYTEKLQQLKLHSNRLKHLNNSFVENLVNIQSLQIQHNEIDGDVSFYLHACHLKYVNMSSNNIVSVNITIHSCNVSWHKEKSHFTVDAGRNGISSISVVFEGAEKKLYFNDNKVKSFNHIRPLDNVKILNLRRNKLEAVPCDLNLSSPNMTVLDLGENQINYLCSEGLKAIRNLHYLFLDKNKLVTFSPVDTNVLHLSENPLGCTCDNEPMKNWLLSNTAPLTDNITCVTGLKTKTILTSSIPDNCGLAGLPVKSIIIAVLSTILPVLVISMFALKFKYEIQVIAFYKWNVRPGLRCCKPVLERHAGYTYDAFVCFAEEDMEYVRHVLVPLLEPQYRLCIYHRDFPVGVDIADAILDVIEDSALTIILLSRHFMRSRWGKYEFKQAHYNSMRHAYQKLLIIVIDEAVLRQKLDLTLRSILFAKAYLKNDDALFTQKLLFAMPDKDQQGQTGDDGEPSLVHVELF